MGKASDKIGSSHERNGNGDPHKRVGELREEIVRKREQISLELEELRRRRADAIVSAQQAAKLATAAGLGLMIVGSLTRACIDLFRKDDEVEIIEVGVNSSAEKEEAQERSITSVLLSAITSIIVTELRRYATDYAKRKLRSRMEQSRVRLEERRAVNLERANVA